MVLAGLGTLLRLSKWLPCAPFLPLHLLHPRGAPAPLCASQRPICPVLPAKGAPSRPLLRSPALQRPLLRPRGQQVPVRVVGHPDGPLLMHLDEQGGAGIGEGIERSRSRGGGWWCNTLLGHLEEQGVTREERE